MANILIVVDSDADRRSQFIKGVEPRLPIVHGLRTTSSSSGDFCAYRLPPSEHRSAKYMTLKGLPSYGVMRFLDRAREELRPIN